MYQTTWGGARARFYEFVASKFGEYIPPRLIGFVKAMEMALPEDKLPRLVVSQGMDATAKQCQIWCVIENFLKACCPHIVTKGKTANEILLQLADFCGHGRKFKKWILAIDMKSMDASWTTKVDPVSVFIALGLSPRSRTASDGRPGR